MQAVRRSGRSRSVWLGLIAGLCAFAIPAASASADPWSCDRFAYLFQTEDAQVADHQIVRVDLASGEFDPDFGQTPQQVNAVGYNVLDDFMYGIAFDIDAGGTVSGTHLVRIHDDGSFDDLGLPPELVASSYAVGDVDANGHYWVLGADADGDLHWYEIDLEPGSPTYAEVLNDAKVTGAGTTGNDIAWIDGTAYGVRADASGTAHLISFTAAGETSDLGELTGVPSGTYGAIYADVDGFLYASNNQTGQIYKIDPATVQMVSSTAGPASAGNDGSRCADAPVQPPGKPKLTLKKKSSKGTVRPGEVVPYKITVRNKGQSAAKRVKVCDRLPSGLRLLRARGANTSNRKACWTIKRLGAGKKRTLKVVAQVKTSVGEGRLTNRATAKGRNTRRTNDRESVRVKPAQSGCPVGRIAARC